MSPALRAARDQWYTRLAREGFRDVEMRRGKRGWYETPAYTYENGETALTEEITEVTDSVWDAPTASHFRTVGEAVAALPRGVPRCRELLRRYLTTGNLLRSAEAMGMTRQQGRTILKLAMRLLAEKTATRAGGADDGEAADPIVREGRPRAPAQHVRPHVPRKPARSARAA